MWQTGNFITLTTFAATLFTPGPVWGKDVRRPQMRMRKLATLTVVFVVIALSGSGTARADCASPSGGSGDVHFSSANAVIEYCNGADWVAFPSKTSSPPLPMPDHGYFVLADFSQSFTNNNFGGLSGANTACLSQLQTADWLGKADAEAAGQLNAANVKAWLCDEGACQNMEPNKDYRLATTYQPTAGGYTATATASGYYPDDGNGWNAADAFNAFYWIITGRSSSNTPATGLTCNNWTSGSAANDTTYGVTDTGFYGERLNKFTENCRDHTDAVVCMVHLQPQAVSGGQNYQIILNSGTSWTVPADWNSLDNSIEVIGGGGGGRSGNGSDGTGGGGGGGYSRTINVALTPGASVTYSLGAGGVANTGGTDTFFCNSTSNCGSIADSAVVAGAKGGAAGGMSGSGLGGSTSGGIGYLKYTGGNGGSGSGWGSSGGGGSAGPDGGGRNGGASSASLCAGGGGGGANNGTAGSDGTAYPGGAGGNGPSGSGGTGSAGAAGTAGTGGGGGGGGASAASDCATGPAWDGGAGGDGSEFDALHGAGGGGGGGGSADSGNGGSGGAGGIYGGGGGGGGANMWGGGSQGTGGTGGQGLIVISYKAPGCSEPDKPAGSIIYNGDNRVLQWCDGTAWQPAGPIDPPGPNAGCTSPVKPGGYVFFSRDACVLQYCDGDTWRAVGPIDACACDSNAGVWTAQTMPESQWWRGLAFGNGTFVAVSGSNPASSPNGITWTVHNAVSLAGSSAGAIAYGNGLFVVPSSGNWTRRVTTSPDGVNWTAHPSALPPSWPPSGGEVQAITYGGGQYVAVGENGGIATSPDGINWTAQSSGITSHLTGIAYGNGLYVAVGEWLSVPTNPVVVSPDGINWTAVPAASVFNSKWTSIAFGNGRFVAKAYQKGSGGTFMYSTDGVNWTIGDTAELYSGDGEKIFYAGGRFVAAGGTTIYASDDGDTWSVLASLVPYEVSGMAYGNSTIVTVRDGTEAMRAACVE